MVLDPSLTQSIISRPPSSPSMSAASVTDDIHHPSSLTWTREANMPPLSEANALPHHHRNLDSHSLFWDDLDKPKFLSLITGFYLGLRLCIYPATLIKTRQQAHMPLPGGDVKRSIINVAKSTIRVGGPRAIYQAFGWNIIGLPVDPLYIASMEYSRQYLHRYLEQHPSTVSKQYSDLFVTLTAGGAAAVVQQTFMVPIDVVTQRLMIQPTIPINQPQSQPQPQSVMLNKNARGIIREILSHDGLCGLYKGYVLTLACVVPFSALQWALYWQTQSMFAAYLKRHPPPKKFHQTPPKHGEDEFASDPREMLTAPASAAVAATVASLLTQPFDTLKTRLQVQTKRTPLRQTFEALTKQKGVIGLMSGAGARILTVMPSAVLSMSAYEAFKRMSVRDQ